MQTTTYVLRNNDIFRNNFRRFLIAIFAMIISFTANAQLTGTKNIPGDYATLAAAITDLNTQGVGAGGVTLNLIAANPQTAPAGGYVIGGTGSLVLTTSGSSNPVIITGNSNTITAFSPQAPGNITDAVFKIIGADYITIQGFTMQENSGNITNAVATNDKTEFGVGIFYASTTDGAKNNTIQNNIINLSSSYQNAMGIYSSSAHSESAPTTLTYATSNTGVNDGFKVYGNTISSVAYGIVICAPPIASITHSGDDIGGSSAATGNTITYGNNIAADGGWGGFTALSSAIYCRNPINESIKYNTIISISLTIQTYSIILFPTIVPIAAVTYTDNVSNNAITLTQTGAGAAGLVGILFNYGNATATHICNNNTINLIHNVSAASSGQITGISNGVQFLSSTISGNTITIDQTTSGGAISGQVGAIYNNPPSGYAAVPGNVQTISSNIITIKQNAGAGTYTNPIVYIMSQNATPAVALATGTVNSNQLLTGAGNTLRTTGSVFGIYHDYTYSTGLTLNGNTINLDRTGGGSTLGTQASISGSSASVTVTNNSFTLTGSLTTGAVTVFNELDGIGSTSTPKTVTGNTININAPALASTVGFFATNYAFGSFSNNQITVSSGATILGTTFGSSGGAFTIDNNTFSLTSSGVSPSITGLSAAAGAGPYTITNNSFNTLSATAAAASAPTIIGITSSVASNNIISGNKILNASTGAGSGTATIVGISIGGGAVSNIFKNKISGLSTSNTGASSLVSGLRITAGTTNNIYNNLIGNLTAASVPSADAIRAINITSTTASSSQNVYFNTIYLNASGPATFGTTGIYHATSATATTSKLDLRNNIVVNLSVPGSTAGITSVLRRSAAATLGNYATTSNNNLYYAGTPASNRAILNDNATVYGTSAASYAFGPAATAGSFQAYVATREANSFTGEPAFTYSTPGSFFISLTGSSADFLHIVNGITTRVESGGQPITAPSITDDYDGQTRNASLPDVGADEFTGITPAPTISGVSVPTATCTVSAHNINANVTVPSGSITTVTLNYNNGSAGSTPMSLVSGSTYSGTIPAGTPGTLVTWTITAVSDAGLSTSYTGSSYTDDPLALATVAASATINPVCSGSNTVLSVSVSNPGAVVIGAGSQTTSGSGTSSTNYISPFTHYYGGYKAQYLIKASELTALGLSAGNITGLAFNITTAGTAYNGFAINLANTAATALTTTFITAGLNQVYTSNYTPTVGTNNIPFSTPFVWDGTSNVLVQICWSNNNGGGTAAEAKYDATSFVAMAYYRVDTQTPATVCGTTTATAVLSNRPQIRLIGNAAPAPTAFSWSNGASVVGTTNPLTVTVNNTTTYTVTVTALGCTKASNPLVVTASVLPPAPNATSSTQCGNHVPTAFVTTAFDPMTNGNTSTGAFKWYDAQTGGNLLQTGGATYAGSIGVTTHFWVSESNASCESLRTDVLAVVTTPDPVSASVNNNAPCTNSSIQLTAANTNNTPVNTYTYSWTASPAAGSGIPTNVSGSPVTVTPTTPGTYIYTVTGTDGSCVATNTVSVSVKPLPVIDSIRANPTTFCSGNPAQLSVYSPGFGAGPQTFPAYTLPGATSNTGGDQVTLVTFGSINNASGTGGTNGFVDYTTTVPAPTITAGNPYSLTIHVANGGAEYAGVWFDWNRNGVYETSEFYNVPLALATEYQGTITINVPSTAIAGNIGMRVRSKYNAAIANTDAYTAYTYGETEEYKINVIGVTAQNNTFSYVWNPGSLSGATVTVTPAATTTYTVTVTNPATTCASTQTITPTVYPLPAAVSVNNSDQCGTQVPTASVSSNSVASTPVFKWYSAATGGTLLQSGTSTTYTTMVSVTTTFYVAELSSNGCEGPRVAITVTVDPPDPIVASSSSTSSCQNSSIDLTVTQALSNNTYNLTWTASPSAGSGIASSAPGTLGTPLTITPTVAGTYVYTITGYDVDKGCTTTSSVTVTVHPQPSNVTAGASAASVCTGSTVNLTSSAVSNVGHNFTPYSTDFETYPPVGWTFINAGSGNSWIASTSVTPTQPVHSGTRAMAYVRSTTSAANAWAITAGQPLIAGDVYTIKFWYNTGSFGGTFPESLKMTVGTSNTVAAQTTVLYNNASLTNESYLQASVTYTCLTTGTYYFGFNCYSAISENVLLIDDVTITGPTVEVPTYSWTSVPAGFTSTAQNPTNVVVNANTTYSVVAGNSFGCVSDPVSVTVNAIPLPNSPIGTNSSQCGLGVPTASVSTGGANGTYKWYDAQTGGTLLQNGGSTYTTAINATTTFWVSESNGTCESLRTPVTVTVTQPASISTSGSGPASVCLTSTITLVASSAANYTYTWTASPAAGSGIPTSLPGSATGTSSNTITPTAAGTYIYTVTGVDNSGPNTCSTTATFTATVNPNPVIDSVRANPATICSGSSTLKVYSSVTGAGPQTFPSYTAPGTTSNTGGDQITLVTFSTINNVTTTGGTNGFVDYTTTVSAPTINSGSSYSLTVHVANGGTEYAGAWFDWNRNGIYEASEFYNVPLTLGSPDYQGTITVAVPANAAAGVIGLRVRSEYNTALTSADAYSTYTFGETEEYKLNVIGLLTTQNPAYNYTWNPGALSGSTVTVSPTVTTTYTPTVTNPATGCFTVGPPVTVTFTNVGASATATPSTPVCAGTTVTLNANPTGGAPFTYSWSNGTTIIGTTNPLTVNPTVTTTYTVTVKDVCNNITTSSVTVTVNALPTVNVSPTSATFCNPGTAVTLTASGASTYAWTPAAGLSATTGAVVTASPTTGTIYTVTGTDGNGCTNTATANITVAATPTATASASPTTLCAGSPLTLTSSGSIPATGYSVGAITPSAETPGGPATVLATGGSATPAQGGNSLDDGYWDGIALPFTFNFYGNNYNSVRIGTNGNVQFGAVVSTGGNPGNSSWTSQTIPTAGGYLDNFIAGPWIDQDLSTSPFGTVRYFVNGVAPNRKFVVSFEVVSVFNSSDLNTSQIILNENGTIDVLLLGGGLTATATKAIGVENATGSLGTAAPGRNSGTWTTTADEGWRFSPVVANFAYAWTGPNSFSSALQNPVITNPDVSASGVYHVIVTNTATGCSSLTANTAAVTVNPRPTGVLTGGATYCNGANTATVLSIAVTGAGPWSGTITDGTNTTPFSGATSPISVTVTPTATTTYTIATLNGSACSSIAADLSGSATVTINPRPTGVISGSGTYCNGANTATVLSIAVTGTGPWSGTLSDGTTFSGSISPISVTVTPTATTTYTIATLNGAQCSAIAVDLSGSATVTINPRPTGVISGGATYCNGANTATVLSIAVTGAGPWSGTLSNGATFSGSTSPISVTVTPTVTTTYTIATLNGAQCSAIAADLSGSATVTINPRPTGVISGSGTYCSGANTATVMSIAVTGAGPWSGTLSDGTTFSGASSPISVTVTPTTTTTYTIATLAGSACSSIAADLSGSATVTVNPLAANVTATVSQPTCTVATGTITVTAPLGSGTTYSLDGGTYQGSVTFSGVAPGMHSLTAQTSSGCFSPASTSVTVNPQPFTPSAPTVTGIVNVCPYVGTGQHVTYTANAAGATSYNWTIPPTNVTIFSGQGTNTLVLIFNNGFSQQGNQQIRVTATSACGTSAQTLYVLVAQYPLTPNPITGPTNICPLIGTSTTATYSIPASAAAISYNWTVPGLTITAAQGQNTTSITFTYPAGYTASGPITVVAANNCGTSGTRSLTLSAQPASQPGLITGPSNVCENIAPNGTAATYSITPVSGATSYTWTVSGVSSFTGQGTASISFTYPAGYTTGSVSVTATNGCGTGSARTLAISRLNPATPSNIDVINTSPCPNRQYTYTLASMPANATSIQWTIPANGSYVSGQGSTSITVSYPATAINGTVTAQAVNNCAVSTIRSVAVKLPACPSGFARVDESFTKGTVATAESMEVKIFPNPTVSDFKLEVLTAGKEEINVRVLNDQGKLFKTFKVMPYQTIALGAELKAGAYLVEVRQGREVRTTKVIKF